MAEMKERSPSFQTTPEVKKEIKIQEIETSTAEQVLPREVKDWMQKVETTQTTVSDDQGQPLLTPATPVNPVTNLPVSKRTFVHGFKKTVGDAGKWLSTFVLRVIKKNKGQVKFKEEKNEL